MKKFVCKFIMFLLGVLIIVNVKNVKAEVANYTDGQGVEYDILYGDNVCTAYIKNAISVVTIPEKIIYEGKSYIVNEVYVDRFDSEDVIQINIPSTVISFGCEDTALLGKVCVDKTNPVYCSDENGWLYSKDKTVLYFVSNVEEIIIPKGVTRIECDFKGFDRLISIEIPDSVESFGSHYEIDKGIIFTNGSAFSNCVNLTNVKLSENLTEIPPYTFVDCTALKEITIPSKVTTIWEGAFHGCSSLEKVVLPDSLTDLGLRTFYGCTSLESITIPYSLETIGNAPFFLSGLKSVTFEKGSKLVSSGMFSGCYSLKNVNLPDTMIEIGENVFGNSLDSIIIPKSVSKIADSAFSEFYDEDKKLIIYGYKDSYAEKFAKAHKIQFVSLDSEEKKDNDKTPVEDSPVVNAPTPSGNILTISTFQCKVKVLSSDVANPTVSYTKSTNTTAKTITIPDTVKVNGITYKVTSIAPNALANNKKLTKVTVGKNVTSIGKNAFKNCKKLKSVTLKATSLNTIGSNAFYGDKNLKTITIKSSKLTSKSIGKNAFKGTNKNLTVKVPNKKIKDYSKFMKKKGNKNVKVTK